MTRLSNLTLRNVLIAVHDALATALAVFASFYLRFEGDQFLRPRAAAASHPALVRRLQRGGLLPLQSDHHEVAVYFVAGCVEYPARGHRAHSRAAGAGLYFCRAQRLRHVLPRQDHHRSLLVPRGVVPERAALCLSLFSLHAGAPSCPQRGCIADAAGRPRGGCGNPAARNRERRRQAAVAGRRAVAVVGRSRAVDTQHSGAWRHRRHRGCDPRFRKARQADHPRGHDAVGIRSAKRGPKPF